MRKAAKILWSIAKEWALVVMIIRTSGAASDYIVGPGWLSVAISIPILVFLLHAAKPALGSFSARKGEAA